MDDKNVLYPQNDILMNLDDLDPELAYEASLHIDFEIASPEVKLTWLYLMCPSMKDITDF